MPGSISEAWVLFDTGKKVEALAMFRSIVIASSDDMAAHRAYQQAMINTGQYLELRKEYRERLARDRKNTSNYYHLGMIEEEVELGKRLANDGLRLDPKKEELLWLVSFFRTTDLAARGKYTEVLEELDKHGTSNPFYYRMQRAGALVEQRKFDEALAEAEKAVAIEPHDPEAYVQRALIYFQRKERDKARESLLPALAFGDFAAVHVTLGAFLSAEGKDAEAKEQYRAVLRAPRDNVSWACSMMSAHQGLGNDVEAERYARLALNNDARNGCARATLIWRALSRGDLDAAEKLARALLELNPRDINGINLMAQIKIQRGRFKEASKLYESGLTINPDDPALLVGFATAATYEGRCNEAQAKLKRAKKLLPDWPDVDRAMGSCALVRGDYQEAARDYARVIKTHPEDAWGYEGLGTAQFGAGYPEAGRVSYQKALRYASMPAYRKRFQDGLKTLELRATAEEKKFPNEGKSAPVAFTLAERLELEYPLAYRLSSQLLVGRPWKNETSLFQSTWTVGDYITPAWSPSGKTLYLVAEGISAVEVATGDVRRILDLPRKALDLTAADTDQLHEGFMSSTSPAQMKIMQYMNNRLSKVHVSSDGQTLYYQVGTTSGTRMLGSIERVGVDGRKRTQIVAPQESLGELVVDGTGRGLVVERWNEPPLRLSFETGRAETDVKPDECAHNASFAPDGRRRVCGRHNSVAGELYIVDVGASGKRRLGLRGSHPAWSPDGKTIAYIHREVELRLLDPVSGKTRRVNLPFEKDLDNPEVISSWSRGPVWSPDSRHVLYTLGNMRDRKDKRPIQFLTVIADLEGAKAWYTPTFLDNVAWSPMPAAR